jgi:hypothetical protein
MALHLGRTRVLLFAKFGNTIPVPFLVVLVSGSASSSRALGFLPPKTEP